MIAFQSPQLTDRGVLAPIFYGSGNLGCEFTFNNTYLWGPQEYPFWEICLFSFPIGTARAPMSTPLATATTKLPSGF